MDCLCLPVLCMLWWWARYRVKKGWSAFFLCEQEVFLCSGSTAQPVCNNVSTGIALGQEQKLVSVHRPGVLGERCGLFVIYLLFSQGGSLRTS